MKAHDVLARLFQKVFKPKVTLSADDWVEQEIRLSTKTSALAGKYSLRHTPYLRQIFQDISNSRVRKIVLKKSAQVGATQFAANVILYYVCNFTFPLLMVMPSKEAAQQFCERSLAPSIDLCRAAEEFITDNPDDLKKTEFLFDSCIVRVIGAGSPSKLASNPAALVIIDEADKMEDFSSQGEAPALQLAEARTITYPHDKKVIIMSTPTEENTSVVHSQYILGSQSKYYIPCPHCATKQALQWNNVSWPAECKDAEGNWNLDAVERSAFYKCESCGGAITEQQKRDAVQVGEWRDTNPSPFPEEIRTYHISALYSFNVTLGALAKMFILAGHDPSKLRDFYNSYLGECFVQRAETMKTEDVDKVIARSPHYKKGELLARPDVINMAVDVQQDTCYWAKEVIYPDGSSAVIDWGQVATLEDLRVIAAKQYQVPGTDSFIGTYRCLIDAGYRRDQVLDFVLTSPLFLPVRGTSAKQSMFQPVADNFFDYKNKRIPYLMVNDAHFKDVLLITTIKQGLGKWYLPQDTDATFAAHLVSENKVEKKVKGQIVTEWVCTSRMNHYLDCAKYLAAFRYRLEPILEDRRQKAAAGQTTRQYTLNQQTEPRENVNLWN